MSGLGPACGAARLGMSARLGSAREGVANLSSPTSAVGWCVFCRLPNGQGCTIVLQPGDTASVARRSIATALHGEPHNLHTFSLIVHRRRHPPLLWQVDPLLRLDELLVSPAEPPRLLACCRPLARIEFAFQLEVRRLVGPAHGPGLADGSLAIALLYEQVRSDLQRDWLRLQPAQLADVTAIGLRLAVGEHDASFHGAALVRSLARKALPRMHRSSEHGALVDAILRSHAQLPPPQAVDGSPHALRLAALRLVHMAMASAPITHSPLSVVVAYSSADSSVGSNRDERVGITGEQLRVRSVSLTGCLADCHLFTGPVRVYISSGGRSRRIVCCCTALAVGSPGLLLLHEGARMGENRGRGNRWRRWGGRRGRRGEDPSPVLTEDPMQEQAAELPVSPMVCKLRVALSGVLRWSQLGRVMELACLPEDLTDELASGLALPSYAPSLTSGSAGRLTGGRSGGSGPILLIRLRCHDAPLLGCVLQVRTLTASSYHMPLLAFHSLSFSSLPLPPFLLTSTGSSPLPF